MFVWVLGAGQATHIERVRFTMLTSVGLRVEGLGFRVYGCMVEEFRVCEFTDQVFSCRVEASLGLNLLWGLGLEG